MYDVSEPMRVVIANHLNHSQQTGPVARCLWIVAPQWDSRDDEPSYHLEIDNSYPRLDGKSYSSLTRVAYLAGDRRVILSDEDFESEVEAVIDHEVKVPAGMLWREAMRLAAFDENRAQELGIRDLTHDEAMDWLTRRGKYSESEARINGIKLAVFDALERGWEALNQFADFSITI